MAAESTQSHGVRPPGYRLPDATRLGRVRLQVSDLSRSTAYYVEVLGLQAVERTRDVVVLSAQGERNPLVELREDQRVHAVPHQGRLGLYHFAILLPDRAALGRFLQHLIDIDERAGMSDHYVSEAIYLQDPDNLGIEVYADRPRSAWQYHKGQLAMSTVPLDVPAVLAAAGDGKWSGLPGGTRLGHVHLHVGDIDGAATFYHDGIGFDKVVWSYPGALFMSAGGYHHHLGTNTWARNAPSASETDARLLDWEIIVPSPDDVDAVARSVQKAGVDVRREDGAAMMRDPWGTSVRVITGRT